jgi:hypothetical protein
MARMVLTDPSPQCGPRHLLSGSGDDFALANAGVTLGRALVHRHTDAERDRGHKLLTEVGDDFLRQGYLLAELPGVNVYLARERARREDRDDAIPLMHAAVDHLFREGRLLAWGIPATGVLVETPCRDGGHPRRPAHVVLKQNTCKTLP